MRKHFYLVLEHEEDDYVGAIQIQDHRSDRAFKDDPGPMMVLDDDAKDFRTVGRKVGIGYHDFEDDADYEDRIEDVIDAKLREVDEEYLAEAGHDPQEVTA
jgi:hypothetical protein